MLEKILVSACLLGKKVRYHGGDAFCRHSLLTTWNNENRLISLCPEVAAGASIPRPPSEIISSEDGFAVLENRAKIQNCDGGNVTDLYMLGAEKALALAKQYHIKIAILKEGSPSCGSSLIYDGSFSGNQKAGNGVTAALLKKHNIHVFSEHEIELANQCLKKLGSKGVRSRPNY